MRGWPAEDRDVCRELWAAFLPIAARRRVVRCFRGLQRTPRSTSLPGGNDPERRRPPPKLGPRVRADRTRESLRHPSSSPLAPCVGGGQRHARRERGTGRSAPPARGARRAERASARTSRPVCRSGWNPGGELAAAGVPTVPASANAPTPRPDAGTLIHRFLVREIAPTGRNAPRGTTGGLTGGLTGGITDTTGRIGRFTGNWERGRTLRGRRGRGERRTGRSGSGLPVARRPGLSSVDGCGLHDGAGNHPGIGAARHGAFMVRFLRLSA